MKSKIANIKGSVKSRKARVRNKLERSVQRLEKAFDTCGDVTKYLFTGIERLEHSFGPDVVPAYLAIDVDHPLEASCFENWDILCNQDSKVQFDSWVKLGGRVEVSVRSRCDDDLVVVRLLNLEKMVSCFGISFPTDYYGRCFWMVHNYDDRSIATLGNILRGDKSPHSIFDDILFGYILSARSQSTT